MVESPSKEVTSDVISTEGTSTNDCTGAWDPELNNCFCSEQIFPETAWMWQSSWVSYYNYDFTTNQEGSTYSNSPSFNIASAEMSTLYLEIADATNAGVLISYIIDQNETVPIPGIAIQNVVNCAVDPDGSIFVVYYLPSQFNGGDFEGIITQSQLNSLQANWVSLNETNASEVFSIAEGYINSWDSLKPANNSVDATQTGITISYGLRTLEPGEEDNFLANPNAEPAGMTGSIVYCNILYFGADESAKNADGANTMLLDFAKPCPTYCH